MFLATLHCLTFECRSLWYGVGSRSTFVTWIDRKSHDQVNKPSTTTDTLLVHLMQCLLRTFFSGTCTSKLTRCCLSGVAIRTIEESDWEAEPEPIITKGFLLCAFLAADALVLYYLHIYTHTYTNTHINTLLCIPSKGFCGPCWGKSTHVSHFSPSSSLSTWNSNIGRAWNLKYMHINIHAMGTIHDWVLLEIICALVTCV